ncbi:MAG: sulfotransferase, partial [Patescibacteria group bacterium]|nr:sulfotransferase [Patescibacteria group bacterium]
RARFIHIVRDPYVLFPSTINLWSALYRDHGLQSPRFEGIEDQVFTTFTRMYEAFERDRPLIPQGQIADVRYEQLVANPLAEMERLYRELDLGDFEPVRPSLEPFVGEQREFKTNRYEIAPELRREISRRWRFYFDRYGYPCDAAE